MFQVKNEISPKPWAFSIRTSRGSVFLTLLHEDNVWSCRMVIDNTLFVSWWHSIPSVMNNCTLACSHKVLATVSFLSSDTIKIELPLYSLVQCDLILMVHMGAAQILHQFRGHLQILGTRRITCSNICTEDLQFLSDLWTSLYIMLPA
jgi:hypothetical protein